ncbi:hypothetical protein PMAYCL1PPCAC_26587, partial [Pristionchus mayeri]
RMSNHIFFKDKSAALKGPYTERKVQEWYREKWFDGSFPFYFNQDDERLSGSESGWKTLNSLRSRNGIGCPFADYDEREKQEFEKTREEGEKKMDKIEEDVADLQQKFTAILGLEEVIDRVEKDLEGLVAPSLNNRNLNSATAAASAQNVEQSIDEMGNLVASYIMDTFAVYGSGDFASWEKKRAQKLAAALGTVSNEADKVARNAGCERILVERMKEKEFFCCVPCDVVLFNYKQTLIHFTSIEHCAKETAAVRNSGIGEFRRILDAFTKLPAELSEEDAKTEQDRRKKYGSIDRNQNYQSLTRMRPTDVFMFNLSTNYMNRLCAVPASMTDVDTGSLHGATAVVMGNLKGGLGRKIMKELNEHIGQAQTWCSFCECKTGDREGLYAHLISSAHLKTLAKGTQYTTGGIRFETQTMVVNVHRKDLI